MDNRRPTSLSCRVRVTRPATSKRRRRRWQMTRRQMTRRQMTRRQRRRRIFSQGVCVSFTQYWVQEPGKGEVLLHGSGSLGKDHGVKY
eukprot:3314764-Prymnesium_polylepis.1